MNRLRAALPLTLTVTLFAVLSGALLGEELRDEFRELYDLSPGVSVTVENTNGSLEIASWKNDQVLVEATKVVKALGRGRAEEALERVEIDVSHSPEGLRIRTRLPRSSSGLTNWILGRHIEARVSYRVKVPPGTPVRALTVNGNISIEAIDGRVDAETTNGQIRISGARASTKATTTNGSIRAEFDQIADIGDSDFRTTNGGITVSVPRDIACSVSASTVHGAVSTDFAIAVASSRGRGSKRLRGDINGGGGRLSLRTVNGSIRLRKKSNGNDQG